MSLQRRFRFRFPAGLARNEVFAPFQHRIFFAVWIASLVSHFGTVIQMVGAAWLMTTIAPSPDYVAWVQAATMGPLMLFALLSGALADTFDRRRVMMIAQILVFAASVAMAALSWYGLVTPWTLLALTFLIGTATAIYTPAWQASVSDMVPRDKFPAAIGLNSVCFNLARSVAPALGGAIIVWWSVSGAFLLNAISTVGLIVVLASWRHRPAKPKLAPERLDRAVVSGVRYVLMSAPLRATLMRALLFGVCASALSSLLPLVARDLVSGGALTYGLLLGAFGVGAMGGGLSSVKVRGRLGPQRMVIATSALFGAASIIVGFSPWFSLTTLALLLAGACWVLTLSTFNITVQTSAPRWVVGRAIASYQMCAFGGIAIGSIVSGILARSIGTRETLIFAGLAMLVALVVARRYSLRSEEALDLSPHNQPFTTLPALDLDPRTGPIVVTIEYRIDQKDAVEFAAAAHKLARIRRGDGASDWTLTQDLDDHERWIERFQSPTWLDHLRRQSRVTVSAHAASNFVRSFHKGPPPVVRRFVERPAGTPPIHHGPEPASDSPMDQGVARPEL